MSLVIANETTFTVLGRAQQRGSKSPMPIMKNGKPVLGKGNRPIFSVPDSNKKSKDWMNTVRHCALESIGGGFQEFELWTGPIILTAKFYFSRPKAHFGTGKNANVLKPSAPEHHFQSPDLSKLLRSLEDGITGIVWKDDKQVAYYGEGTGRYWTLGPEKTEVTIKEIG